MEDVLPLLLSTVVFPESHPLAGQTGEVLGFAVRHRHGVILFDTGVGAGNPLIERYYQPIHHRLESALARHQHQLGDVTAVVNSHLHFDHCGNNRLLPGVPIYAQERELEAAREPRYTVPEWIDFEGAEYRPIDGGLEVAAGIHIVATPGHTGGHQSLVIETGVGPIVLAGQAVYSRAEYDHIRLHGGIPDNDPPPDPTTYLASAMRIIDLAPLRVHFSHDRETWNRSDPSEMSVEP